MREWEMILGDALEALQGMGPGSADALVTDPPAGISFMGAAFDTFKGRAHFLDFLAPVMAECLRVCRPGAVGLVWALPRTSHWTGTALEDAGWQIEEKLYHLFGTGFPKHKSKLKPACEEWILCRKPGPKWLGVEECRLPVADMAQLDERRAAALGRAEDYCGGNSLNAAGTDQGGRRVSPQGIGRWPPNVALSHHEACVCRGTRRVRGSHDGQTSSVGGAGYGEGWAGREAGVGYTGPDGTEEVEDWACVEECPVRLLDGQAGERASGGFPKNHAGGSVRTDFCVRARGGKGSATPGHLAGAGNASRFFYVSKADKADRGEGNDHNTVKPTALMSWLVKLVARPGETVLDPFAGSASTGVACLRSGRRFIGIERDPHYHAIALKRLAAVDGPLFAAAPAPEKE